MDPHRPSVTTDLAAGTGPVDQIRLLLSAAALAPSLHNSQPWTFRAGGHGIDVFADAARDLPVADPEHRQRTIACSAAVFNMRVAAAYGRFDLDVTALPDPAGQPDLAARVRFAPPDGRVRRLGRLYPAVAVRRTNRFPFADRAVPSTQQQALSDAAVAEGARLTWVSDPYALWSIRVLTDEAERADRFDPQRRRERASWVGGARRFDGVPSTALGPRAATARRATRDLAATADDLTRHRAAFEPSAAMAVLTAADDDPASWWVAGQALEHVWLAATTMGLSVSFRNAALEYPHLRWLLRDPRAGRSFAQMVLRVGYGSPVPPTPRRPLGTLTSPG